MKIFILSLQILLISALLAAVPCEVRGQEWQAFISKEGRFQVLMPGTPTLTQSEVKSPLGKIKENLYSLHSRRLQLDANYSDLPGFAVFFAGYKTIFKKAKEALLEDEAGTELSYKKIMLNGYFGAELEYQVPSKNRADGRSLIGKARFYLVQKRLYVLVATTPSRRPHLEGVDRFLNSFQLFRRK